MGVLVTVGVPHRGADVCVGRTGVAEGVGETFGGVAEGVGEFVGGVAEGGGGVVGGVGESTGEGAPNAAVAVPPSGLTACTMLALLLVRIGTAACATSSASPVATTIS